MRRYLLAGMIPPRSAVGLAIARLRRRRRRSTTRCGGVSASTICVIVAATTASAASALVPVCWRWNRNRGGGMGASFAVPTFVAVWRPRRCIVGMVGDDDMLLDEDVGALWSTGGDDEEDDDDLFHDVISSLSGGRVGAGETKRRSGGVADVEALWSLEDEEDEDVVESLWSLEDDDDAEGVKGGSFGNGIDNGSVDPRRRSFARKDLDRERLNDGGGGGGGNDDATVPTVSRTSPPSPVAVSSSSRTTSTSSGSVSPLPRGVGRLGYNLTHLALCQYDLPTYRRTYGDVLWQIRLDLLRQFKCEHDHANPPYRHVANATETFRNGTTLVYDVPLGVWLTRVRSLRREGKIEANQIEQLDELGVDWGRSADEDDGAGPRQRAGLFQRRLNALQSYVDRHGHADVPRDWEEDPHLGRWVHRERALYRRKKAGRNSALTDAQEESLRRVGFVFDDGGEDDIGDGTEKPATAPAASPRQQRKMLRRRLEDRFERRWFEMLRRFQASVEAEGGPPSYESDLELALWAWEQQRQYDRLVSEGGGPASARGCLSARRFRTLTEVGFDCSRDRDKSGIFGSVDAIKGGEGASRTRLLCPPNEDIASISLSWEEMLSSLRSYREAHGHVRVTPSEALMHGDGALYAFVRRVRWERSFLSQSRKQRDPTDGHLEDLLLMEPGRIEMLDDLDFDWNDENEGCCVTREYAWWQHFYDLLRYKNGLNAPGALVGVEGEGLKKWVKRQENAYRGLLASPKSDVDENEATEVMKESHFVALLEMGLIFDESMQVKTDGFGQQQRNFICQKADDLLVEGVGPKAACDTSDFSSNRDREEQSDKCEWDIMLGALEDYKLANNNCFVPLVYKPNPALGRWVFRQRKLYCQGTNADEESLSEDQICRLLAVGLDLDTDNMSFGRMAFRRNRDLKLNISSGITFNS